MTLYSQLSKISFLKNRYAAKFVFVGILGILLPFIILFVFTVYIRNYFAPIDLILTILTIIIVGTVIMVRILKSLLLPIIQGSNSLFDYETTLKVPMLPLEYTDEAGIILRNIQTLVQTNQRLLADKKELCDVLTTDLRDLTLQTAVFINTINEKSANAEVQSLTAAAIDSIHQQLDFVQSYVKILGQEEIINKQPIKVRKVNIQDLLDEVTLKRKAALEAKNLKLIFSLKYSRIRLKVSNTLFLQALGYLIDNAIKHAPQDSKIEVSTDKHRGRLVLQIRDYGVGFNARQAEKIFSKFQKTEAEEDYTPGTAMYLVGQIIERFGGTIVAESDGINHGARFIIELKLQR